MAQYPPYTASGAADSNGDLTVVFRARGAQPFRVTQITAEMPDGAGAACAIRLNGALISPLVATGDSAGGDPPVWVTPGDELAVVWTGAPADASGQAVFIYDLGSEVAS